jgi:spore coat protein U-like protein
MLSSHARAATAAADLSVSITIENECEIAAPNTLNFGTQGVLSANVDTTADFTVTCTANHPYTISMGSGITGTTADREMSDGVDTSVHYQIYTTTDRDVVWDGTNTVAGTGTGSAVTHTAYGRVPPQATPAATTYTDTVQITVNY